VSVRMGACVRSRNVNSHIQHIQHLEPTDMYSRLELCRCVISNPTCFVTFCSPTSPIAPAMESTIQETHIYGIVIILMELSKSTTNIAFT